MKLTKYLVATSLCLLSLVSCKEGQESTPATKTETVPNVPGLSLIHI